MALSNDLASDGHDPERVHAEANVHLDVEAVRDTRTTPRTRRCRVPSSPGRSSGRLPTSPPSVQLAYE
ncbi:hypothetical protein [Salinigranum salinum]|uniref:hypothetical protein n=1 Tax=Salinigranum salinum TaxID=1364937 RepID=UPI0031B801B0